MTFSICLPRLSPRCFPPPGPKLYESEPATDLSPDQQAARQVLALARRRLPAPAKYLGWAAGPLVRFQRLFWLHRAGLAAELSNRWRRADFFWQECLEQIRQIERRPEDWESLAQWANREGNLTALATAEGLRRHVLREVLLETHCGLYNGAISAYGEALARAQAHFAVLERLVEAIDLPSAERQFVIGPPLQERIVQSIARAQWGAMIDWAAALVDHFPENERYQEQLARLHRRRADALLIESPHRDAHRANAVLFRKCAEAIETLRGSHRRNMALYEILGQVHHLRAKALAGGDSLSESLVAIEMSLTYDPTDEDARRTAKTLRDIMEHLRERAPDLQRQAAQDWHVRRAGENEALLREARKGLDAMCAYRQSEQAADLRQGRVLANAWRLWQRVGLSKPAEIVPDEKLLALQQAIESVVRRPPATCADLPETWRQAAAERPLLADLDGQPVHDYLARELFNAGTAPPDGEETPLESPQCVLPRDRRRRRGGVPFLFWAISFRDPLTKALAAAAMLAVVLVALLGRHERHKIEMRDAAFARIAAASEAGDDQGVAAGAEEFFSISLLARQDRREDRVRYLQKQAIDFPSLRRRDALRPEILQAHARGDHKALIATAEAYFAAPLLSTADQKEGEVRGLYDEAFVAWFVALDGKLDDDARQHVALYKKILDRASVPGSRP